MMHRLCNNTQMIITFCAEQSRFPDSAAEHGDGGRGCLRAFVLLRAFLSIAHFSLLFKVYVSIVTKVIPAKSGFWKAAGNHSTQNEFFLFVFVPKTEAASAKITQAHHRHLCGKYSRRVHLNVRYGAFLL